MMTNKLRSNSEPLRPYELRLALKADRAKVVKTAARYGMTAEMMAERHRRAQIWSFYRGGRDIPTDGWAALQALG